MMIEHSDVTSDWTTANEREWIEVAATQTHHTHTHTTHTHTHTRTHPSTFETTDGVTDVKYEILHYTAMCVLIHLILAVIVA